MKRNRLLCVLLVIMILMLSTVAMAEAPQDKSSGNPPSGMAEPPSGTMGQPPEGGPGGNPPEGMGAPPQDGMGGPGEMGQPPEDGIGGPGGDESVNSGAQNATNTTGAIAVSGGDVAYDEDAIDAEISVKGGKVIIDGLSLESGDYSFTGVSATDGADVTLKNASIVLDVDEAVFSDTTPGEATYINSGIMRIEDSEITVNGAGRYTVAVEGDATLAVNDTVIMAGGDAGADGNTAEIAEPASNAGLLISGTSRANFSVGATDTYYYNSLCVTEGWAALSTDSATGDGLDFTGYNTEAIALHGGYGIYADTNCQDALYGVTLVSAEVGTIISNNGSVTMTNTDGADDAALEYLSGEAVEDDVRSAVIAGRNDFQLHSPDMMSEGADDYTARLSLSHTDLVTDDSINGDGLEYTSNVNGETYTIQSAEDYAETYGAAVGAYVEHVSGSAILVKSTSAEIALDDVTVDSYNGVAIHTVLNSDSMSRYLKQDVGAGVNVAITDSGIDGSIVHEDYQRDLSVALSGSTLTGAVETISAEEWNALWADYADDESACWVNLDAETYVTESHATAVTLMNGSTWKVTGESRLTSLSVDETSTVEGTVLLDGEEVTLTAGEALEGNITVLPLA